MNRAVYELSQISKIYQVGSVDVPALKNISLTIEMGESVALRGPSGSGKSTLLNVLGLIERKSEGTLRYDGADVSLANDNQLTKLRRDSIGFIFQNFNLIPFLTARENVEHPLVLTGAFSKGEVTRQANQVLEEVGLGSFANHRPAQLSGGQRQRVAIARALVKQPKVILADEPTANLDSATAEQVMSIITTLQRRHGLTFIVATHDNRVAESVERVIHLKDGQLRSH